MGQGIAGTVAQNGASIIVNDPYNDNRFDSSTDKRTGYRTHNMMTVPITTWKVKETRTRTKSLTSRTSTTAVNREIIREKCIIGCVQVLNKKSTSLASGRSSGSSSSSSSSSSSDAKNGEAATQQYTNYNADDLKWLDEWNTLIGVSLNQAHNHEKFLRKIFSSSGLKKRTADDGVGANTIPKIEPNCASVGIQPSIKKRKTF